MVNVYLYLLQENFDYKKQNITFKLYGKKYSHEFEDLEFKIYSANKLKQNILLGSSTSMTFRPELLGLNYYNSSKGNLKMSEIRYFLDNLNYNPDNIIIFLDPYHFNDNFPEISKNKFFFINKLKKNLYKKNIKIYYWTQKKFLIFSKYNHAISDIFKNFKKIIALEKNENNIGFNAKLFNSGFRSDGSFEYPNEYRESTFVKLKETYDLNKYSKKNLYFGKNANFVSNFDKKLSFLVSKNQTHKKKILIVLNTVESNFYKTINYDIDYMEYLKKYQNICNYLIQNKVNCFDRVNFAYENKVPANLFFDPFHFRYELSNNLLNSVLRELN